MQLAILAAGSNREHIALALAEAVTRLEADLPDRIRAHYLMGSYAVSDPRPSSDIDLIVVLKAGAADEERLQVRALVEECGVEHGLDLSAYPISENALDPFASQQLRAGSLFVYGEDIRSAIPPVSAQEWASLSLHRMYLVMGLSRRLTEMRFPVVHPDPNDEFYGCARERSGQQGTRMLVTGVGWCASALIAHLAGHVVTRKAEVPGAYRLHVGDEWTPFIDEIYARCRDEWSYEIPNSEEDRLTLRRLCARSVEFENHFLMVYRDFVVDALGGEPADREAAERALERLPFRVPEIDSVIKR